MISNIVNNVENSNELLTYFDKLKIQIITSQRNIYTQRNISLLVKEILDDKIFPFLQINFYLLYIETICPKCIYGYNK